MHALASERKATVDRNDAVILEWRYTPANFFEEPVDIPGPDYEIHIDGGEATAYITPEAYDGEHKKRDELHDVVEDRFLAQQVLTHRKYELPKPGMSRVRRDGRRDVTIFAGTAHLHLTAYAPDIRITDRDGNVVVDTKQERLDRERVFREAVARVLPRDALLEKMLRSYQGAVGDPADELMHLYEILDALKTRFRTDAKAQQTLGIEPTAWSRFFALTNDRRLQQGRHRGQHLGPLRNATAAELDEARKIARSMIEAYVRYADRSDGATSEWGAVR